MKGIFISDLHLHLWSTYPNRLEFQLSVLKRVFKLAFTYKVPLFFAGDFFHIQASLENGLLSIVLPYILDLFHKYPISLYGITGNHDISKLNTFNHRSPSYITTLANTFKHFHSLDFDEVSFSDFKVFGVPYLFANDGLMEYVNGLTLDSSKFNILMLHTDFKGQQDTNGIIVGKGEGIKESSLSRFNLVLSGHIHKPGKLRKNIYCLGSPFQLRVSDMGGKFGYWIMGNDFKLKFREVKGLSYRLYDDPKEMDNKEDYWIKRPKSDEEISEQVKSFLDLSDRKAIVRNYLKYRGITSRTKKQVLLKLINQIDEE